MTENITSASIRLELANGNTLNTTTSGGMAEGIQESFFWNATPDEWLHIDTLQGNTHIVQTSEIVAMSITWNEAPVKKAITFVEYR